jgi:Glucose / Sorbosone dehydrogenase
MKSKPRFTKRAATRGYAFAFLIALLTLLLVCFPGAPTASAQYPSQSQVGKDGTAVLLEDYVTPPLSSSTHSGAPQGVINFKGQLGRMTSLRSEPAKAPLSSSRLFVVDQSGTLYLLDKTTKQFAPYITFTQIFPKFTSDSGLTTGLLSLAFDPGYAKNGKFYTVHIEKPAMEGSAAPVNTQLSSLNLTGYAVTDPVNPPAGQFHLEAVLIEWTDTNIRNATFEGAARELLRVSYDRNHPMSDLLFNPLARPHHEDYGNLYIAAGDGAQGETPGPGHFLPQQLNNFMGKILRITPDINLHPRDVLSQNGRYRIPSTGSDPNPFVSVAGARPEIYAYGLRNPHRMAWDVPTKAFLVDDIGLHSWEEIDIVAKGANYGYAEREGNEQVFIDANTPGKTGGQMSPAVAFPEKDRLTVEGLVEPVTPLYPAAVYSHQEGDSIGSGAVYRGKLMPQLRGKYIFNDMTTGRIFYVDLAAMLATHGERNHQAQIHELQIMYKGPNDQTAVKRRMFDIVAENYARRGGTPGPDRVLPAFGNATTGWKDAEHRQPKTDPEGAPYGGGRADIRIIPGPDGELYILSKSDGAIRKLTAQVSPPPASD